MAIKFTFNPLTGLFDAIGLPGGSDVNELNFSFEEIIASKVLTIPQYQQMAVFGGILIDGALLIEGSLIMET